MNLSLETRLQKRIHASLYALIFLSTLLGLSVLLESCANNRRAMKKETFSSGQQAIRID